MRAGTLRTILSVLAVASTVSASGLTPRDRAELEEQAHLAELEELTRRVLSLAKKLHGPENPKVADLHDAVGRVLQRKGAFVEAEASHRDALGIRERSGASPDGAMASGLTLLGAAVEEQGRFSDAVLIYERAIRVNMASSLPSLDLLLRARENIARAHGRAARGKLDGGVIVVRLRPGSVGGRAGVNVGDWIRRYDATVVRGTHHLRELTQASKDRPRVVLELIRGDKTVELLVPGGKLGLRVTE